jgi:hypothetical protein
MKIAWLTVLVPLAGCPGGQGPDTSDPTPETGGCEAGYFEYSMGLVYYIDASCWSENVPVCLSETWWAGYDPDTATCDDRAWVAASTDGRCFMFRQDCGAGEEIFKDPLISDDVKAYEFCYEIFGGDGGPGQPDAPECASR